MKAGPRTPPRLPGLSSGAPWKTGLRRPPRLAGLSSALPLKMGLLTPPRLPGLSSGAPWNMGPRGCRSLSFACQDCCGIWTAGGLSAVVRDRNSRCSFSCRSATFRLAAASAFSLASFSSTDAMMVSTMSSASSPNTESVSPSPFGVGGSCMSRPSGDFGVSGTTGRFLSAGLGQSWAFPLAVAGRGPKPTGGSARLTAEPFSGPSLEPNPGPGEARPLEGRFLAAARGPKAGDGATRLAEEPLFFANLARRLASEACGFVLRLEKLPGRLPGPPLVRLTMLDAAKLCPPGK